MDKTQKKIIFAMMVVFVLMLGMLIMLPAIVGNQTTVGEFVPPEFDPNAQLGAPNVTDPVRQFAWLQLGDDIRVGLCGSPVLTDAGAEFYFASDSGNTAWLLVKILDESGAEIGRSGLIRPGEYLQTVALKAEPAAGSSVTVKILSYEPETYYSLGSASAQVVLAEQ